MIRICCLILLTLFSILTNVHQANAFFTQNYKKNMLYGAFKHSYNTDLYLGVRVGFLLHPWTPNVITAISSKSDAVNSYTTMMPNLITKKTSSSYAYGVGIDIGLHVEQSKFRHELNFEWYGISSGQLAVTSDDKLSLNGEFYSYITFNNKMISSIGTYADIYKIGYSLHYNFENVFSLLKVKWDVFLSIGAGLAFINGGTYIGSQITKNSSTDDETSTYSYQDNEVDTSIKAAKNVLTKTKSFGVGYKAKIGMIANISQSFAASVALSFSGTSRPLFTTKFSTISKPHGVKSHLEYHISIEFGMLLKAFEISL